MTDRLYAKYMWLITTVYNAGKISFADIARKWDKAYINDLHQPLKLRTFHNHRNAILMQFGIVIECQRGSSLYYIDNINALKEDSIKRWLLDSFAVSNILMDNRSICDRIMLEDVPSGRDYLDIITRAMRENHQITIDYEDFFDNTIIGLKISPYFIRLFKRRWYVLALVTPERSIHRFGLDRIKNIVITDYKYDYPKDFSPEGFFYDYYGVFHDASPQIIQLKAYKEKPNYLRSLPLHHSQREIYSDNDYTIFEYKIAPTYDFIQEILSHGNQLEVISPESFRKQIKTIIQEMFSFYE